MEQLAGAVYACGVGSVLCDAQSPTWPPRARGAVDRSLGSIVRAFKGAATRQIREAGKPAFAWQDDFYERIVRDDRALTRIRQYILDNPARWTEDRFYAGTR